MSHRQCVSALSCLIPRSFCTLKTQALLPLVTAAAVPATGGNGIASALPVFEELSAAGVSTQGLPALLMWASRKGYEFEHMAAPVLAAARALGLNLTVQLHITGGTLVPLVGSCFNVYGAHALLHGGVYVLVLTEQLAGASTPDVNLERCERVDGRVCCPALPRRWRRHVTRQGLSSQAAQSKGHQPTNRPQQLLPWPAPPSRHHPCCDIQFKRQRGRLRCWDGPHPHHPSCSKQGRTCCCGFRGCCGWAYEPVPCGGFCKLCSTAQLQGGSAPDGLCRWVVLTCVVQLRLCKRLSPCCTLLCVRSGAPCLTNHQRHTTASHACSDVQCISRLSHLHTPCVCCSCCCRCVCDAFLTAPAGFLLGLFIATYVGGTRRVAAGKQPWETGHLGPAMVLLPAGFSVGLGLITLWIGLFLQRKKQHLDLLGLPPGRGPAAAIAAFSGRPSRLTHCSAAKQAVPADDSNAAFMLEVPAASGAAESLPVVPQRPVVSTAMQAWLRTLQQLPAAATAQAGSGAGPALNVVVYGCGPVTLDDATQLAVASCSAKLRRGRGERQVQLQFVRKAQML